MCALDLRAGWCCSAEERTYGPTGIVPLTAAELWKLAGLWIVWTGETLKLESDFLWKWKMKKKKTWKSYNKTLNPLTQNLFPFPVQQNPVEASPKMYRPKKLWESVDTQADLPNSKKNWFLLRCHKNDRVLQHGSNAILIILSMLVAHLLTCYLEIQLGFRKCKILYQDENPYWRPGHNLVWTVGK